jgi:outer membrane protein assembly factor BamB
MKALRFDLLQLILLASVSSYAEDWPQFLGPNRNGVTSDAGWTWEWPKSGPKELWEAQVGTGFASVSVGDGRAYTMGSVDGMETVHCFDAKTGEKLWDHSYPSKLFDLNHEGGPSVTPTLHEGKAFTLGKMGKAICFDAKSGTPLWTRDLTEGIEVESPEYGYSGSPLVVGEKVLFELGPMLALNKETGATIWRSEDFKAGFSSPTLIRVGEKDYVATLNAFGFALFDLENGQVVRRHPFEAFADCNIATPLQVGDSQAFISTGYGRGCELLDLSEGVRILWKNKTLSNHFSNSVLWNNSILGFDGHIAKDRVPLKCLDPATGRLLWEETRVTRGSLLVADGKSIVLTEKGELVVAEADRSGFQELARAQVQTGKCWIMPVLANGLLYCRNAQGRLVCLDLRA